MKRVRQEAQVQAWETRWLSAAEAIAGFVAILLYIWWLRRLWPMAWVPILGAIFLSHVWHHETPAGLGLRAGGFRESLKAVWRPALLLIALLLAGAAALNTIRNATPERVLFNLLRYLLWGGFQQYLLNGFFANRLALASSNHKIATAAAAASLFSLVHVPNLFLMGVTLAGGYICARLYLEYRNLPILGLLHGVIGWTLHLAVPDAISHYFMVGPGYWGKWPG